MNIFFLDKNPTLCAQYHNNRHCVKMIVEIAQLLSTAHRVLDGKEIKQISKAGRKQKYWQLSDEREQELYKATHISHPSAIWVRKCEENYIWLVELLQELLYEYTFRYGKTHKTETIIEYLKIPPKNISKFYHFSDPTVAMDSKYIIYSDNKINSLLSYRNYYKHGKSHLACWNGKTNSRQIPDWF